MGPVAGGEVQDGKDPLSSVVRAWFMRLSQACRIIAGAGVFSTFLLAKAQGAAFTYQGRLEDSGAPASGNYDLTFGLYDTPSGGAPVGGIVTNTHLAVSSGLFSVSLDFGDVFDGNPYWLELAVQTNGGSGNFTRLTPRQALMPVPYAQHSATATTTTGPILLSQLPATVALLNGPASFSGAVTAPAFSGNGAGLTNVTMAAVTNVVLVTNAPLATSIATALSNLPAADQTNSGFLAPDDFLSIRYKPADYYPGPPMGINSWANDGTAQGTENGAGIPCPSAWFSMSHFEP